jgi:hypothetical protein
MAFTNPNISFFRFYRSDSLKFGICLISNEVEFNEYCGVFPMIFLGVIVNVQKYFEIDHENIPAGKKIFENDKTGLFEKINSLANFWKHRPAITV